MSSNIPLVAGWVSKIITSDTTITLPSVDYLTGDLLVLSVMHRSTLTTPDGWTLRQTVGPISGSGVDQWTSILTQTTSADGSVAQSVTQASAGRFIAAMDVIRNASGATARGDLSQVYSTGGTSFTTGDKGDGLVMWAISAVLWDNDAGTATNPWTISNASAPAVTWPDASAINQPRLGVFVDYGADAGPRTFTPTLSSGTTTAALAAVEVKTAAAGSTPKTTGQIWPRGKR